MMACFMETGTCPEAREMLTMEVIGMNYSSHFLLQRMTSDQRSDKVMEHETISHVLHVKNSSMSCILLKYLENGAL